MIAAGRLQAAGEIIQVVNHAIIKMSRTSLHHHIIQHSAEQDLERADTGHI